MDIVFLGQGVWGTALASLLSENNIPFSFWDKKKSLVKVNILILSLPTNHIREALIAAGLQNIQKPIVIVNTSKGIEKRTHKLPREIVKEVMGSRIDYYSLMGPSFADEVIHKMPTIVNLGYEGRGEQKEKIKSLFQTEYFRIKMVKGVIPLELCGALKNVYAIGCGVAEGLGYKTNTKVKLLVLAMEELYHFFEKRAFFHWDTAFLPGTVGDLILTCSSPTSRNFQLGTLLPTCTVEEAKKKIGQTIEGVDTAESIEYLVKSNAHLPLAEFIVSLLYRNTPQKVASSFAGYIKSIEK